MDARGEWLNVKDWWILADQRRGRRSYRWGGEHIDPGAWWVTTYILRRLLGAVPLVLGIATIIFFAVNLAPGDPVPRYLNPNLSAETLEQIHVNMGLDQPVHVRYVKWMGALARGDLGYSFTRNRPVLDIIKEILPNTLLLSVTAIEIAFVMGILLGIARAVSQYSILDTVTSVIALRKRRGPVSVSCFPETYRAR